MKPRNRMLKPEFLKHSGLYDLEVETALPVRLAFAGLWCMCDREGRFEWKPRELKTDVLPYDPVDFGAVLDALARGGFIQRYEVGGRVYGCVPSFRKHQSPNLREATSEIPRPPEPTVPPTLTTDDPTDLHVHAHETHVQDDATHVQAQRIVTYRNVSERTKSNPHALALVPPIRGPRNVAAITTRLGTILEDVAHGAVLRLSADNAQRMQAEFVFAYWAKLFNHGGTLLDAKRERTLRARLKENDGNVQELLYALDGALRDDWTMGRTDRSVKKYDGIETIFRDRAQVEKFSEAVKAFKAGKEHPMLAKYRAALEGTAADATSANGDPTATEVAQ